MLITTIRAYFTRPAESSGLLPSVVTVFFGVTHIELSLHRNGRKPLEASADTWLERLSFHVVASFLKKKRKKPLRRVWLG